MARNIPVIIALVLGFIALILFFAGWLLARKQTPSDADLRNSRNLQLAGIIFLALTLILMLVGVFRPTLGQQYYVAIRDSTPIGTSAGVNATVSGNGTLPVRVVAGNGAGLAAGNGVTVAAA